MDSAGRKATALRSQTGWEHLYVDILVVPDFLRGLGYGTRLMQEAENEAIRRRCQCVWLDTYSFQARGFYERLGYSMFGMLPEYPTGHARHFLKNVLS